MVRLPAPIACALGVDAALGDADTGVVADNADGAVAVLWVMVLFSAALAVLLVGS